MKTRGIAPAVSICVVVIALTLSAFQTASSQRKTSVSDLPVSEPERDLLNEINQCRAHPQLYASYLEKLKPLFNGKDYTAVGQAGITTQEGWSAVEEATKSLRITRPTAPPPPPPRLSLPPFAPPHHHTSTSATRPPPPAHPL